MIFAGAGGSGFEHITHSGRAIYLAGRPDFRLFRWIDDDNAATALRRRPQYPRRRR